MSNTLLSTLMTQVYNRPDDNNLYYQFAVAFSRSVVGVMTIGAPVGVTGRVESTSEHLLSLGRSVTPDGRSVLLTFADPVVFSQRYGQRFNAEMSGIDALRTAEANLDCEGLQVNSALNETSIIITREMALAILRAETAIHKPWWKFWQ